MSKTTKIFILAFTHIVSLLIGGAVTYQIVTGLSRAAVLEANAGLTQSALVSRYEQFVEMQKFQGASGDYKEALLKLLTVLEHPQNPDDPLYSPKIVAFDKMVANARLYALEVSAGNDSSAKNYLEKTVEMCKQTSIETCLPEKIIFMVQKLDEYSEKNSPWVKTMPGF